MQGKIVKNISNLYDVLVDNTIYHAKARGKFKNMNITPLVGDEVKIDIEKNYIMEILPRYNCLDRPRVSNVDIALIITSCKEPNISLNLLDKEITSIVLNNIEPVIVFSKLDLLNPTEINTIETLKSYYQKIGYQVFYNTEMPLLKKYLANKEIVVTGQTGSGKSTFINKLGNLNIETNEISHALGRGKHTTRHAEIYHIDNINIIDTPGFSSLDINKYTKKEIADSFIEFKSYSCRFKDCLHDKEIDCGVKEALNNNLILRSRYDNYLAFLKEAQNESSRFIYK
jgi:ribosome biogenesis GTPase